MIQAAVFNAGVFLRSPEIFSEYRNLKASQSWSIDRLRAMQSEKLKSLFALAFEKSEYYRDILQGAGIDPKSFRGLEDLGAIPTSTKADIRANKERIQNRAGYRRLFYSETSGSTGNPLVFFRDSAWDAGHRAAQMRGYSWYGVKPWERNGYFWGYSLDRKKLLGTRINDALLNRFRLFTYDEKSVKRFCEKLKTADYLEGYSSMIYEVAKKINKNGYGPYSLKLVKGTSEKIFDNYQAESQKAFGRNITSEYGAAETGIIAFECPHGKMHVVMENVIVEEVDGEAVVTNLLSRSFPIIRYRLGDSIKLDQTPGCPCGMEHQKIAEVMGRIGKVIRGRHKDFPSLTLYYVFKNLVASQGILAGYQAVQNEIGRLAIRLDRPLSAREKQLLLRECAVYFGDEVIVEIDPVTMERSYASKFSDFISYLS